MLTFIDILTNFDILRQPYTKINVKHRNFYMFNLSDICAFLKVDYIKHQPRVREVTKCPKILLWRLWTLFWDKFALCLFVMVPQPPPSPTTPAPDYKNHQEMINSTASTNGNTRKRSQPKFLGSWHIIKPYQTLKKFLSDNWSLLKTNSRLKHVFQEQPKTACRQNKMMW